MNPNLKPILFLALALFADDLRAATIVVKKGGAHPTIASGIAAAAAGDTLEIKAGVYQENVTIGAGLAGLTIVASKKAILEALPAGGAAAGPGLRVQAADVSISGLVVRNATLTDSNTQGFGIEVTASGFEATNLTLLRCDSAGIFVGADGARITRCRFFAGSDGIRVEDCQDAVVSECLFQQMNDSGVSGTNVADLQVLASRFVLTGSNGVSVSGGSSDATVVRDCVFENSVSGAAFVEGTNATIENNSVVDCDSGFFVRGSAFTVRGNTIRGSLSFHAIFVLAPAASGLVDANEITDSRGSGVAVDSGTTSITVQNNVIRGALDTFFPAIDVDGNGSTFTGNQIVDCVGDAIQVTGDAHLFDSNTIEDCLRDGFDFEDTAVANTLANNTIRRCQAEGIDHQGSSAFMSGNVISDCRIDVAVKAGSVLNFSDNTFTTGGVGTNGEID